MDDYFLDADGDTLSYSLAKEAGEAVSINLDGSEMTIEPLKPGTQDFVLSVTDGEETITHVLSVHVKPLWQVYWWVIAIVLLAVGAILRKILYKPQAEVEKIENIKSKSRFNGKLDLYFTVLPEEAGEIPPLVFPLHKLRESKVCLGDLLHDYPEEVETLGLNRIYLIADEGRKLILYHNCEATIMIGNAIICRQLRHMVNFGDVIYVTSQDGRYDMELHYISLIK
ncbi:MAG: hypothetical protein ACRDBO_13380 [Lachnospiraceae bacterium]